MHAHTQTGPSDRTHDAKRLLLAIVLTGIILLAEVAGGMLSGSLALLSDAGHMLTDLASLALSYFALRMAARPATDKFTFGMKRLEILAALLNGILLLIVCTYIGYEAVHRLMRPVEIDLGVMGGIALLGLAVNIVCVSILGRSSNLNVRSAFLHVLGDLLSSVGVLVGAAVMAVWNLPWIDPALSLVIAAFVLVSGYRVIRESSGVLMEAAPEHLDVAEIRAELKKHPVVLDVHDLHVWTITSGLPALSCHVVTDHQGGSDSDLLITDLNTLLSTRFGIDHTTIQIESRRFSDSQRNCATCE